MLTDAQLECLQRDGSGFMPEVAADLLALRRAVRELQATAKKDGCPCDQCIAIAALPVPKEEAAHGR